MRKSQYIAELRVLLAIAGRSARAELITNRFALSSQDVCEIKNKLVF
ncbi:hypothetical protein NIES23_30620 [Trichormus variabilis NIES-23]|uniref:Uncharacterized protein n=1 Tax=Trichormus variabilis NIES-23 TaxID=1973479 RepID=A0A1Z4KMN2_ANAVA|nr:hypothetical protein NIES23_30620 [Trichormus variabilis NIES-23]